MEWSASDPRDELLWASLSRVERLLGAVCLIRLAWVFRVRPSIYVSYDAVNMFFLCQSLLVWNRVLENELKALVRVNNTPHNFLAILDVINLLGINEQRLKGMIMGLLTHGPTRYLRDHNFRLRGGWGGRRSCATFYARLYRTYWQECLHKVSPMHLRY